MNTKIILRFYFSADKLERALNNLILKKACSSSNANGDYCSVQIVEIINVKVRLARLWEFLHSILRNFSQKDLNVLSYYALSRKGISTYSENEKKEVKKLTVRFARRAKGIKNYLNEIETLNRYYTLL